MRSLTPTLDKTTRCMDCDGLPKPCTICAKRLREFRAIKLAATSLVALVRWCDRNDWGCVPKRIESGARRAAARLASREQSKKGGARP